MPLHLSDHWVWDSWTAFDGDQYHLFFLRASRALVDPERRHGRAAIGHAVSPDRRSWTLVADALVAEDGPRWDDRSTWTGSVVQAPDGTWRLFYTGTSRADGGLVQSIGWATSPDLLTWTRSDAAPIVADPRWYEKVDGGTWPDEAWRDPFVFADPGGDGFHMLVTARAKDGDPDGRAVVGHVTSPDLETWTVQPPLTAPAGFGQMEVVQSQLVDGQPVLVFSCTPRDVLRPDAADPAATGTWVAPGESVLGPWDLDRATYVASPDIYAAQLVEDVDGRSAVYGFVDTVDGEFVGDIADPTPWDEVVLGRPW